jgi:O-antigen/teichoic acid export membrane protein
MNNAPTLTTDHLRTIKTPPDSSAKGVPTASATQFSGVAAKGASKAMPLVYCLTDQAFSIGGVFLANVMLTRTQSKEEYGAFALSYSIYTFLSGLNNASILEPYTVYGSGRYRDRFTQYARLMARSSAVVAAVLTAGLLIACLILREAEPQFSPRALVGLALTVGVLVCATFVRRAFYVQGRPAQAARMSVAFFLFVTCGLLLSTRLHVLDSFTVFLILGAAWVAACAASARGLFAEGQHNTLLQTEPRYWEEHWKYTKWVLGTAMIFQVTTQGYYWLVASFLSLKDVAQLKAIYILVTPADQFYIALNYLVLPAMAAHFAAGRMSEYFALWRKVGLVTICVTLLFAAGVRIAGRQVVHALYAGKFDGVAPLLFLLALLPLLMGIGNTMNDALKAAELPKMVFYAYLASGAATLLAGIPLVSHFGLPGAIYGMLVSGATYSAFLALAFFFQVSRKNRKESPGTDRTTPSPDFRPDYKAEAIVSRNNLVRRSKSDLAPVVLFVYNRPAHTRRTVESLLENHLAARSELFVFSDGGKNRSDRAAVEEVRRYVRGVEGFRSVTIVERDQNSGLAKSVISGVTEIFDKYERQIVLEDDLLTAPDFLTFMNDSLDRYEQETKIFSVSAFNFAVKVPEGYRYDSFCSHRSSSWGWGTWKNRWERVDWEVSDYAEFRANKVQQRLLNRGGADLSYMLGLQMAGAIDSWAIRWAYAHYKHESVAMLSTVSKVYNIGLDGSGVHCRRESVIQPALARDESIRRRFPESIELDPHFVGEFSRLHPYPSLVTRLSRYLYRKLER